jgi:hypothetical protein
MDENVRKEINLERKIEFKEECNKVNAKLFEIRWNWEIVDDVGQMIIYDMIGKLVALWEETCTRIKELQDKWGFYIDQWLVIAVNKKSIVETYYGVFALGWTDENKLFRGIFFREEDVLYEDAIELGAPSEQSTLDELKELEELDGLELVESIKTPEKIEEFEEWEE